MEEQLQQAQAQHEQQKNNEEQTQMMMTQIMDGDARERLSRIALVKPEKAEQIKAMLIGMAQKGQIKEKVTEPRLRQMLESLEAPAAPTKITILRKGVQDDDEDDYSYLE